MYRFVVLKCNIILNIERNKLPTTSSKHSIHCNTNIRGPGSFIRIIGVKGTKEGFPCISCIMLHANMKD